MESQFTDAFIIKSAKTAINYTLKNEGVFDDNPNDKGGLTKYGISWRFYSDIFPDKTKQDLEKLTVEEASDIYIKYFWRAYGLYRYDTFFSIIFFDQLVNRGQAVIRSMQITCNRVPTDGVRLLSVDGIMGQRTASAVLKITSENPDTFLLYFIEDCLDSYCRIVQRNPNQSVFIRGWIKRAYEYFYLLKFYKEVGADEFIKFIEKGDL